MNAGPLRSIGEFVAVNLFFLSIIGVACAVLFVGIGLLQTVHLWAPVKAVLGMVLAVCSLVSAYFYGKWAHAKIQLRM